jgi:hypothetical protein
MAIDRDEDGLDNGVESQTGTFVNSLDTGTSPALADSDGDGFDDGVEVLAGTNPVDPESFPGGASEVPGLNGVWAIAILAGSLITTSGFASRRRRGRPHP